MAKKPVSALRRTAGEVKRYRILLKLVPIIIGVIAALLALVFVITVLYARYGSFTVTVGQTDSRDYGLTLDFSRDFVNPTSYLNTGISVDITNIDGGSVESLPTDLDSDSGGDHSGENFAAYTFFCKNAGKKIVTYSYEVIIVNATQSLEKAARVRVYVDGAMSTYARPASDGSPEPYPENTKVFQTYAGESSTVTKDKISGFKPGDITRYTIVVWLEGNDPDCTDDKIGGSLKIAVKMKVEGEDAQEKDDEQTAKLLGSPANVAMLPQQTKFWA